MATASAHTTLQGEFKAIVCLIDLMKQEQQFLVAADADALNTVTPLKAELIEQLAKLAAARHRNLAADGADPSEAGMEAWVARMASPQLSADWQQLLEKMREAKELNRVNGMLINKQMNHTQVLINAMRTPAGAADANVYGPSGQATAVNTSRRLVVG